jgi:hypothetical protein
MNFPRFAGLSAIVAALLVIADPFKASAGEVNKLEARIEIFGFAGLHVLTNRTTIAESADRYAIAMDLDTRGLASVFVELTSHSEVHGVLATNAYRPEAYRAEVRRNGVDRHYGVDYRSDGAVINASMPLSPGGSFSVPTELIRGTVDQLTAYFLLERQLARGGPCAFIIPVFDGSGLYNLRFADVKKETLAADNYQNFSGPAQVCSVTREDLVANPDRNEDTYRSGRIWYARVTASDRLLPVRMEYDTAFGVVTGYLAEVRGRGVDVKLMRQ